MSRKRAVFAVFTIAGVLAMSLYLLKIKKEEKVIIPTKTVVSAEAKEFLADQTGDSNSSKKMAVVRVRLNPVSK